MIQEWTQTPLVWCMFELVVVKEHIARYSSDIQGGGET